MEKHATNTSVDKALDILLLFREKHSSFSIDAISQRLGVPRSTTYRYVRTLTDRGFLEKVDSNHYRLGLVFLELSRVALESNRDIRLKALPSMKRVAEEVGESVSLMRLFNGQVVCVESIEGRHALRVKIEPGRVQPIHAGASSRVLLAYMASELWDDYIQEPLTAYTETTLTSPDALKRNLRALRERGYAVSDGEIDVGARAVAVPLCSDRRGAVAALSIEGPASRMDDAAVERYAVILQREAEAICNELV